MSSPSVTDLQPLDAQTSAEFVALLRCLKVRSGLNYRQLEARATAAGDVLPRSTLSAALKRSALPREELVVTFVRACGAEDDDVTEWITARRRLAEAAIQDVTGPPDPAPRANGAAALPPLPAEPVTDETQWAFVWGEDRPPAPDDRRDDPGGTTAATPPASSALAAVATGSPVRSVTGHRPAALPAAWSRQPLPAPPPRSDRGGPARRYSLLTWLVPPAVARASFPIRVLLALLVIVLLAAIAGAATKAVRDHISAPPPVASR